MKLTGKKVIVTGASRSIGREIAISFAKQGAEVVISYNQNKTGALETVKMIESYGVNALAIQADFAKPEVVQSFFNAAIDFLGRVDILINNAAALSSETIFDFSYAETQKLFQVNTISPLHLSQLCAKNMIKEKSSGCIINISSIAGIMNFPKRVGYASSKAAMNKWTQNIALNLAEHKIRVNAIAPGVVNSGMNENTAKDDPEWWKYCTDNIPLKRPGEPSDISNMAVFLASDEARWITGKIIEVDGGHTL